MRQIHWDMFAPSLAQALYILTILCVWTIVGTFVMKYFVRQAPILNLAAILFWAIFRVQIVLLALVFLASIFGISLTPLSALLGMLASCAIGWLVTQHLSRNYGVSKKFPAVGAKVMTTLFMITLLIVVTVIVITGA
jgi:hypothetical protein